MTLPTAHNYVIEDFIKNLVSLESNFLKPNVLTALLKKTEIGLNELVDVMEKKNFPQEILEDEKENINLIIENNKSKSKYSSKKKVKNIEKTKDKIKKTKSKKKIRTLWVRRKKKN